MGRARDVACAVLAAALGLTLARLFAHDDWVGDGPRFQRLLRNHLLAEHALYLPAIRASLWCIATPEEAMRWLSALGAASLGLGSWLTARVALPPLLALALSAAVSCSASVLYHGGATELHAFHGGFTALLLARCVHARGTRVTWLDAVLLVLTAGSHSSGGLAAMACAALRAERAGGGGLGFLASRAAWSVLLRSLVFAALPLVLSFTVETRLMRDYVAFIARQETGQAFARVGLVRYLLQELLLPAPALVGAALLALLLGFRFRADGRAALLLAFLGFGVVYGPIGIGEEGGYFIPLLPLCALAVAVLAQSLSPLPRTTLLLVVLAAQVAVGFATREPAPVASAPKREQQALLARLPPHTLLLLYVPWEASRATQDYLWPVHDPTRDNTALFDRDPEDILATGFRADPQAALLARVRAHRAAGGVVLLVDPAAFPPTQERGIAALRALVGEFGAKAAGLPGLLQLE